MGGTGHGVVPGGAGAAWRVRGHGGSGSRGAPCRAGTSWGAPCDAGATMGGQRSWGIGTGNGWVEEGSGAHGVEARESGSCRVCVRLRGHYEVWGAGAKPGLPLGPPGGAGVGQDPWPCQALLRFRGHVPRPRPQHLPAAGGPSLHPLGRWAPGGRSRACCGFGSSPQPFLCYPPGTGVPGGARLGGGRSPNPRPAYWRLL